MSKSQLDVVINGVQHQKEHHRGRGYAEELRLLLKNREVLYDERHLLD